MGSILINDRQTVQSFDVRNFAIIRGHAPQSLLSAISLKTFLREHAIC